MALESPLVDERELSREEIIARIPDGIISARDDVVGIILFGSFARGEAWRDIDVLTIHTKLDRGNQAWVDTALSLERAIPLLAVRVIPYSLKGFRSGLQNHSPFLLDVITDGLLVTDRADLGRLVEETRQYLRERGIHRTRPGGWRFPVHYRRPTALSQRTNEEFVRRWLGDAERDLGIARVLQEQDYHDRSVYHAQQSAERAVKSVLACLGGFERSHYVAEDLRREIAARDLGAHSDKLLRLADIAGQLEHHVTRTRYIMQDDEEESGFWDPAEKYSAPDSAAALAEAQAALAIARDFGAWWFAPSEGADRNPASPAA